ncbi:hypothetical protein DIURU_001181 [Diutina rugosa]|uniref:WHIM1 domain-containing protein n=1 Tax=Diutina rugosa TaxID=5481 RepID=A0A642UVG3_DIURU|nr:uncharacterized protein DIURU_001181 [Diutina rugosa]KAA8906239.1 hypothetical protein DIURU_001181 [Diutina rugosa]
MASPEDHPPLTTSGPSPELDGRSPSRIPPAEADYSPSSEFKLQHYTPTSPPQGDTNGHELPDFQVSTVKVVEYQPGQKVQRLGRPRRHLVGHEGPTKSEKEPGAASKPADDESGPLDVSSGLQVSDKSNSVKSTTTTPRKRMAQSQLDVGSGSVEIAETKRPRRTTRLSQKAREAQANNAAAQELEAAPAPVEKPVSKTPTKSAVKTPSKSTKSTTKSTTKSAEKVAVKAEPTAEAPTKGVPTEAEAVIKREETSPPSSAPSETKFRVTPAPPTPLSFGSVSRTGLTPRVENKLCRQLPGPVTGVHYDLYDDNFINKPSVTGEGLDAVTKQIAGGFTVTPAKYAADIVYILEFLNKFRDIIGIDGLSPQSFEKGLGLTSRPSRQSKFTASFVSPDMQSVFLKLLALVLNRKKEVVSQASAIMELRPQSVTLGLAKEWKRTVVVKVDHEGKSVEVDDNGFNQPLALNDLVDESRPDLIPLQSPNLYRHYIEYNPFDDPEFEQEGLAMLSPEDRLIMLRTLVHWAMAQSDQIRSIINSEYQTFEMSGDKDTLYAARIVLLGPQNCEEMKKEAEVKLNRRKAEEAEKYVDPTSNPLDHGLRLRLVEGFAGDGGAFIGRFYISGMLDPNTGGLASMDTMRKVWENPESSGPQTRRRRGVAFKLYVQDVHKMLNRAYTNDGLEFDANGNEVASTVVDSDEHTEWYEVASNSEELSSFVHYLSEVLGHDKGKNGSAGDADEKVTSLPYTCGVYSSLSNLHRYLSHLLPVLQHNEVPT